MALEIFDGRPGDGKSYCAVALRILPHLATGGYVCTNLAMKPEGVAAWMRVKYGKTFRPDRLQILGDEQVAEFHKHIPAGTDDCPVLCVLDEVHLWFNARDWARNDSAMRKTFEFATQHRKYNLDVIMISQHFANIDSQFVRLVSRLSRFRDLKKWHPPGMTWFRIPFFRFVAAHYDRDGKTLQDRQLLLFDKYVGAAYDTKAVSRGDGAGGGSVGRVVLSEDPEAAAVRRKLRMWVFSALGLVVALVACFVLWRIMAASNDRHAKALAAAEAKATAAESKPRVVVASSPAPPVSIAPVSVDESRLKWLESPPLVDVLLSSSAVRENGQWRVSVELDGARQILRAGEWTTRGRVTMVTRLAQGLWLVRMWADEGAFKDLRVRLRDVGVAGANYDKPGSLNADAAKIDDVMGKGVD